MAFELSAGVANDVIHRFASGNPQSTWADMRRVLTQRFAPIACPDLAFRKLSELKQLPGESAVELSERLLSLATEAFSGETNQPHVERQLVVNFTDALAKDEIRLCVMREEPYTLAGAVQIADMEEKLEERLRHRQQHGKSLVPSGSRDRRSEPGRDGRWPIVEQMEVDHARSRGLCYYCQQPGHQRKMCPQRAADHQAQGQSARGAAMPRRSERDNRGQKRGDYRPDEYRTR